MWERFTGELKRDVDLIKTKMVEPLLGGVVSAAPATGYAGYTLRVLPVCITGHWRPARSCDTHHAIRCIPIVVSYVNARCHAQRTS